MWEINGSLSSDKRSFEKTRLGGRAVTQYQIHYLKRIYTDFFQEMKDWPG